MKTFICILLFFAAGSAYGMDDFDTKAVIRTHNVSTCGFWTRVTGARGRYAYGCASSPRNQSLADGYSTQQAIRELEARIRRLEAKNSELLNQ